MNEAGAPTTQGEGLLNGPLLGPHWLPAARARSLAVALGAVTLIVAAISVGAPPPREYHADEGVWLAASDFYFRSYFVERDWSWNRWKDPHYEAFSTRNPVLGKYSVGFLVYLLKPGEVVHRELKDFACKDETCPNHWNLVKVLHPPQHILERGRVAALLLGCLAAGLCHVFMWILTRNAWVACLASVFFAIDPLFVLTGGHVMMDVPAVASMLGSLAIAAQLAAKIRSGGWGRPVLASLALGAGWALAFGVKLTSAIAIPISAVWLASAAWSATMEPTSGPSLARRRAATTLAVLLVGATLVSLALTILSNPFLHHDPIAGFRYILEFPRIVAEMKMPDSMRVHGPVEGALTVYAHNLGQPTALDAGWLGLQSLLTLVGAIGLVVGAASGRVFRRVPSRMLLAWFVPAFAVMIVLTPYNWDRWYVFLEPVWAILAALGVVAAWRGASAAWWTARPL